MNPDTLAGEFYKFPWDAVKEKKKKVATEGEHERVSAEIKEAGIL